MAGATFTYYGDTATVQLFLPARATTYTSIACTCIQAPLGGTKRALRLSSTTGSLMYRNALGCPLSLHGKLTPIRYIHVTCSSHREHPSGHCIPSTSNGYCRLTGCRRLHHHHHHPIPNNCPMAKQRRADSSGRSLNW